MSAAARLVPALAQALARPIATFDAAHLQLGPLSGGTLARAAAAPAFAGPLNRAVSRQLGLAGLQLGPDFPDRLRARPGTRLATLLVTEPLAAVASAALLLAAAVLHRPVVAVVLGAPRARLRAALGEAAFEVATREALLLHAPLVAPPGQEALGDLSDEAALRGTLLRRGLHVLHEAADAVEPALGGIFARRFAPQVFDERTPARAPSEERLDHVLKLLRRRMPPWAASIA